MANFIHLLRKHKSLNFEFLLKNAREIFKEKVYYLIDMYNPNDIEHYQEMADLFLSNYNIETSKIEQCKFAIGEVIEYARDSGQKYNSLIDVQLAVTNNNDVRLMVKFDNTVKNVDGVDSEQDVAFLSLKILKNMSKKFSFNRVLTFNSLDIVF